MFSDPLSPCPCPPWSTRMPLERRGAGWVGRSPSKASAGHPESRTGGEPSPQRTHRILSNFDSGLSRTGGTRAEILTSTTAAATRSHSAAVNVGHQHQHADCFGVEGCEGWGSTGMVSAGATTSTPASSARATAASSSSARRLHHDEQYDQHGDFNSPATKRTLHHSGHHDDRM